MRRGARCTAAASTVTTMMCPPAARSTTNSRRNMIRSQACLSTLLAPTSSPFSWCAVHKHDLAAYAAHVYSRTLTRCLLSSTPRSDGFVCIASLHSSNLACMQVTLNTGTLVAAVKPDNTNHRRTRTFIFTSGATSWLEVEPEVRQGGQTNWPVRWSLTRCMASGGRPTLPLLVDSWMQNWLWHRTLLALLQVPVDFVTLASCNFDVKAYLIGGLACDPSAGAYTTPVGIVQAGCLSAAV